MKKFLTFPNIQAVIFLVMTVAETVLMILFKPIPLVFILSVFFLNIFLIIGIRFAYQLAYFSNRWHSFWRRQDSSGEDDEPSEFIVGLTKVSCYVIMLIMQIVLMIF